MSYSARNTIRNKLIASLPPEDAAQLDSISRIVRPSQGEVLASRSNKTTEMWFPHAGVVALTASDAFGRSVQTGVIGSEGCVGLEALFEHSPTLPDAIVQIEGQMSVIPAAQLRSAMIGRPSIMYRLMQFLLTLSSQSRQTVACNRLHSVLQRCCRWLLTFGDYMEIDDLPLTQENLATLLGSGRPRINGVLATLEESGLVQRRRGQITLLQRSSLEERACGCYRTIHSINASLDLTQS